MGILGIVPTIPGEWVIFFDGSGAGGSAAAVEIRVRRRAEL